jgi:hypothetical protein
MVARPMPGILVGGCLMDYWGPTVSSRSKIVSFFKMLSASFL